MTNIEQGSGETPTKITQPSQPAIPENFRGLPSELAEEMMVGGDPIDETARSDWAARKQEILAAIREEEDKREDGKSSFYGEQYSKLSAEDRQHFPQHQAEAQAEIVQAIQGKTELDDLSAEEQFVIGKLKQAYADFKAEHPDQPFNFDPERSFGRAIDKRVYDNLVNHLAFGHQRVEQKAEDQGKLAEVREGIKELAEKSANIADRERAIAKLINSLPDVAGSALFQIRKDAIATSIYHALVHRGNWPDIKEQVQNPDNLVEEKHQYAQLKEVASHRAIASGMGVEKDGWFHIVTRPDAKGKIEGPSQKRYATLSPEDWRVIGSLDKLAILLKNVAEQTDDSIEVKTGPNFQTFEMHNDSLVIHFKKQDSLEGIENALKTFLSSEGITEQERELGRTKIAQDTPNRKSFSENISDEIVQSHEAEFGKIDSTELAQKMIAEAIERSKAA